MSVSTVNAGPNWRPKAIVFDLLTALLDSWSVWDASTPSGTPSEGRPWRHRYLELTFSIPGGAYTPYEDCVRQAARDIGLPESAPETLLRNWGNLQAWPEVAMVLPALRERGYKLGVVTNCSKHQGHIAVRRAEECTSTGSGHDFTFDAVITAEESGFYKPTRQAYEALLTKMGLDASDVLFVAGSSGDVQGATDAGMKVVWHNKVGLSKKGEAVPMKEASTLDAALGDFL
ncbi:putative 2-deoxyglucose-6-phosphate phosphatase [Ilyonectria destructans]|nr:putative 2-deoxyglucose-6-phosphate phosphatase [Ilyonectria destructans]